MNILVLKPGCNIAQVGGDVSHQVFVIAHQHPRLVSQARPFCLCFYRHACASASRLEGETAAADFTCFRGECALVRVRRFRGCSSELECD